MAGAGTGDSPDTVRTTRPARRRNTGLVPREFVLVANRLPIRLTAKSTWEVSPGGLVTAMSSVLANRSLAWVGWPGERSARLDPFELRGNQLVPVPIDPNEIQGYYEGFSNTTLWPLFHDMATTPQYHRHWWERYREVNLRFATGADAAAAPGATVWIHDYQLMLVPRLLRERRPDLRIGFFLHIPFPAPELFTQLPWRAALAHGVLGADLVGFQTEGDAANFSRVAQIVAGSKPVRGGLDDGGRHVGLGAFPISVDTPRIREQAAADATTARFEQVRSDLGSPARVLLGVDRLDYTKGITVRMRAFRELLEDGVIDGPKSAVYVQVAVPSRERAGGYAQERRRIAQLVAETNGKWGDIGRPAISYITRNVPFDELLALYRAADVMLVTPLRDGMNLVAKEFVAARVHHRGVLVLSEFAGAARELGGGALLVNPYDVDQVKVAIATALHMDPIEQEHRMRTLQQIVTDHDVHRWSESFLSRLQR
jgi:trehalose 6-phosphate synthase